MKSINSGKKMTLSIIIVLLLLDIIVIGITSALYIGDGMVDYAISKLIQGLVRFVLTCILFFFLFKGHKWAKWILIVLLLVSSLISFITLLVNFNFIMFFMGLLYLCFGIILISSKSVNKFLRYQKGEYIETNNIDSNEA